MGNNAYLIQIVPTISNFILSGNNNQNGQVTVDAQRIRLLDGGRISSSIVRGNGQAGKVSIQAKESLEIRGVSSIRGLSSAVLSSMEAGTTGQGGQIAIKTENLLVSNGGSITSELVGSQTTFFGLQPGAKGTAGSIDVQARNIQVSNPAIDGFSQTITGITTSVGNGAVGSGGTINLTADNLRIFDGGQITSSSLGQGNAGNINLQVKNIDLLGISQPLTDGRILPSSITASSTTSFTAGSVTVKSDTVSVRDNANITVSNTGSGNAGNLNITANNILLDNQANLQGEVNGGNQGKINLQANDFLLLRRGSNVTTNATGTSSGGNIRIIAGVIAAIPDENSNIVANAVEGNGGNIEIALRSGA